MNKAIDIVRGRAMSESEISYWIATMRVPGWQQSKACKEQIEAMSLRQQRMLSQGRSCWMEDAAGFVVEEEATA